MGQASRWGGESGAATEGATSAFACLQAEETGDALKRHGARSPFTGKSGAMLHGFPDTARNAGSVTGNAFSTK